jgi:hypothetical protein
LEGNVPKHLEAKSPTGSPILGTLEHLPARAEIKVFWRNAQGELEWDYAGETEVFWNGQETRHDDKGHVLFFDEANDAWTEDDLTFTEVPE